MKKNIDTLKSAIKECDKIIASYDDETIKRLATSLKNILKGKPVASNVIHTITKETK